MKIPSLVAVAAGTLLTLSACGTGSSSTTATQPVGSGGHGGGSMSVTQTSLGKVLVDSQGMTLYSLSADSHDHSTCTTQCLQFWPAVSPGGAGVGTATTGRTTTPDGTAIATVAGHPVYTFSQDQQPGDVNGEGITEFGGTWHAVSPTGGSVTGAPQAPSGSSSPSTGGGYAY
jgi:predicted lipoprotein with Yx(FWY)xxD motif